MPLVIASATRSTIQRMRMTAAIQAREFMGKVEEGGGRWRLRFGTQPLLRRVPDNIRFDEAKAPLWRCPVRASVIVAHPHPAGWRSIQ